MGYEPTTYCTVCNEPFDAYVAREERVCWSCREEMQHERLLYKYAHIGCPDAGYEDNCAHPNDCAEAGRCLDLAERAKATDK
jgi:hypothetical protein